LKGRLKRRRLTKTFPGAQLTSRLCAGIAPLSARARGKINAKLKIKNAKVRARGALFVFTFAFLILHF